MAQRKFSFNKPSKLSFSPKKEKPVKPKKIKAPKPPKAPKQPKAFKASSAPKQPGESGIANFFNKFKKNEVSSFSVKSDPAKKRKIILIVSISVAALLVIAAIVGALVYVQDLKNEAGEEVVGIYVAQRPNTSYFVGDSPDYDGLIITIKRANGTTTDVKYSKANASEFRFSGFNSQFAVEDQIINIQYGGFSCSYHIGIKDVPVVTPDLDSISMQTLPKIIYDYVPYETWFDPEDGMILRTYNDGSSDPTPLIYDYVIGFEEAVEDFAVASESGVKEKNYTLKVKYTQKEKGITKETSFDITIKVKEATE